MRTAWLLFPVLALVGCDSVVATSGTDGETSTTVAPPGSSTSPTDSLTDTSPTTPTTTGIGPSSTTDNPLTAGSESSSGYGSSSSSTGYFGTSSSSSGESSSGSSSSTDPTGVGFIDPSDTGPGIECNTYLQDCPDGEKCNPWANDGGTNWNALGCFPVDPAMNQPGEPCQVEESGVSGIDNCELGAMCWDVDTETNIGTCVSMCAGSPAMPICDDPATSCVISNGDVLNLCLPGCDPLMQDCIEGQGCYPIDDNFVCAPDASDESGQVGEPCSFINGCDPGNACIQPDIVGPDCPAGSPACCTDFCSVAAPGCTLAEQECIPWFEEGAAPPQYQDVGICSVPA